jgi:hypothetical protein
MERRAARIGAGAVTLLLVTATAAAAVNTGLLGLGATDHPAGTLELGVVEPAPVEVATTYVDIYEDGPAADPVVITVPAPSGSAPQPGAPVVAAGTTSPPAATLPAPLTAPTPSWSDDEDDSIDDDASEYEDDSIDDEDHEDDEDDSPEGHEYEGWDEDD